jgi:hypothetical protein
MLTVATGNLRCTATVQRPGRDERPCKAWGWFIHEGKRYCCSHHPVLNPRKKK